MEAGLSRDFRTTSCNSTVRSQLWKWGSGERLFHVASSLCLALNVSSKMLTLVDCGSTVPLTWRCLDGAVYTVYQMGLTVTKDKVGPRRDSKDSWVRGGTQENICQRPYRGKCCLPFLLRETRRLSGAHVLDASGRYLREWERENNIGKLILCRVQ